MNQKEKLQYDIEVCISNLYDYVEYCSYKDEAIEELNLLKEYIEKIFEDKNLQIIITTHSPIFLSDIFIENIELLDFDGKIIKYKVTCSKGTYIRVLSEDIAEKLGTVGFMSSLIRTRVGNFKIEDAEKFIKIEDILDVEKIELNDSKYKKFLNGILINVEGFNNGWIKIYKNGEFKGFGIVNKNLLKRKIVIDE
mgnify:CR=1 FL=1